jgi:hypothetical protein
MLKDAIEELRDGARQYESDLVTVGEASKFARDRATSYFRDGYPVPDDADLYWKGILKVI